MPEPHASAHDRLKDRCRGISAGIFAAPLGELSDALRMTVGWGCALIHFDVMDGEFVPQITGGPGFVAALGDGPIRDVHLMVEHPLHHIESFAKAGADIITVHAEAEDAALALARIPEAAAQAGRPILKGLAVMPGTPLDAVAPLLEMKPDLVLVLALDPRDGVPADLVKASERLRDMREMAGTASPIWAIDGGVTAKTIEQAVAASPDIVVSGSAIYRAADPQEAYRELASALSAAALAGGMRHAG